METKALIPLVGSKVCLEGVIRLLDQIKIQPFSNFSSWQILAILAQAKQSPHNSSKHAKRVYEQRKVKYATCKNVKGRVWRIQTQLETRMFLSWFRQVVLSYIHVDGDFNPRRVTVARVHGGLHPRRVHKEATLSIPPWSSPTKDLPHSGRSSRSRRSPCPYKLLGSTPQSCRRLPSDTQTIQETPLSKK